MKTKSDKELKKKQKELLKIQTRRLSRMLDMQNKLSRKAPPGEFRATFSFSPTELGKEVLPSKESIEQLGLKRATDRLSIQDHYVSVSVRVKGEPTKENLAQAREQTLHKLLEQQKVKEVNPLIVPGSDLDELTNEISSSLMEPTDEAHQTTD